MTWISIIGLLLIGMALLGIEILLIPGTTLVGALGLCVWATGVALSFLYLGHTTGAVVLISSLILVCLALVYAFRAGTWKRFALRQKHQAQVNRVGEEARAQLQVGERGKCRSMLRPVGQVAFRDQLIEARTDSDYLDEDTEVEITRITPQAIYVRALSREA